MTVEAIILGVYEKYSKGICDDPVRSCVLRAFSAAVEGREGRMTYLMATDEQMRDVLDDDDYALWLEKKAEHLANSSD